MKNDERIEMRNVPEQRVNKNPPTKKRMTLLFVVSVC